MRRVLFALATIGMTVVLQPQAVQAAANTAIAVPGSAAAGWATPALVLAKAAPANLINADAIAPHDIKSVAKAPNGQPWFGSPIIGVGTTGITINPATPPGEYEFFCSVHPTTMRGTAIVQ